MRPQHANQPFRQLRQIVINLFAQAANGKREAFKQALHVRVGRARLVEVEHRRPVGVSLCKFFCRFTQVAHFGVEIAQG